MLASLLLFLLVACLTWIVHRPSKPDLPLQSRLLRSEALGGASPVMQDGRPLSGEPGATRPIPSPGSRQRVLKYGHAAGELGMVKEKGQTPVGPESFVVAQDGGILLADVVNQRIVVYSRDGTYVRTLGLPGIALGDVATDKQGRVYVYDQVRRTLHQYGADGTPRSTLELNPKDIDTRGYFHVTGDAVYFADAAVRDVLVATVREDGELVAADRSAERASDGIHGESGRIYSLSLDKGQALGLKVRDPAAGAVVRRREVSSPGIVSARFVGEDQAQRFYIQTERLAGTNILLEVLAFSPGGEYLATTRLPENDYAIWTARLVDVQADGTLVQFLPQQNQAKLNLFAN